MPQQVLWTIRTTSHLTAEKWTRFVEKARAAGTSPVRVLEEAIDRYLASETAGVRIRQPIAVTIRDNGDIDIAGGDGYGDQFTFNPAGELIACFTASTDQAEIQALTAEARAIWEKQPKQRRREQ